MIRSMIVFVLAASMALAFPAAEEQSKAVNAGGCPGGYAEGAEIERGRLIFICQGGQVVGKGCIAEDLTRLSIGGNYDTKQYRKKCQKGADGELSYDLSGCLQNGQEHKVGESWDDGKNHFTCKSDGAALKVVNQGCVEGGKRLNINDQVAKDNSLYTCQESVNGGSKLVQAGCVKDGKQFKAGDSYDDGKYWYNCTRIGREKVVAKASGCISNGKRLNDGDRYDENGVSFECIIDNDKPGFRVVGCAQKDESGSVVTRKLGCTWGEGAAPLQVEYACREDGTSAKKVPIRCNYSVSGGNYQVDPGCFRAIDKGFVGCKQSGDSLSGQTYDTEAAASGAGLHAC